MSIGRICCRDVHLAEATESVAMAAMRMRNQQVGTLVVLDDEKRPIGIITDRDLAVRVMAAGKDPHASSVGEVMTRSPQTVGEEAPIEDVLAQMSELGIRRMVVVDEEYRLAGIVSLDDVLALLGEEIGRIGRLLEHQAAARREPQPIQA